MNAIPTKYNGINFRSRLEAKWANFFDILKWKWEYEPVDFNGWIPDFCLLGKNERIYVEVKPVYEFPEEISQEIDKSGCDEECLIVGACLLNNKLHGGKSIGWLRERIMFDESWNWEEAPLILSNWSEEEEGVFGENFGFGFCHSLSSFRDRINNYYSGGYVNSDICKLVMETAWKRATNNSQWKGIKHAIS